MSRRLAMNLAALLTGITMALSCCLTAPPDRYSLVDAQIELTGPVGIVHTPTGAGSAVLVYSGPDEADEPALYFLTAAHVVVDEKRPLIQMFHPLDRDMQLHFTSERVAIGLTNDLALLKVVPSTGERYPFVALWSDLGLFPGEHCVISGAGYLMFPFYRDGTIAAEAGPRYVVTVPVFFGDSGGGLFVKHEGRYRLAGILSAMGSQSEHPVFDLAHVVPLSAVKGFLEENGFCFILDYQKAHETDQRPRYY